MSNKLWMTSIQWSIMLPLTRMKQMAFFMYLYGKNTNVSGGKEKSSSWHWGAGLVSSARTWMLLEAGLAPTARTTVFLLNIKNFVEYQHMTRRPVTMIDQDKNKAINNHVWTQIKTWTLLKSQKWPNMPLP